MKRGVRAAPRYSISSCLVLLGVLAPAVAELVAPDGSCHPVPSAEADAIVRAHLGRDDVRVVVEGELPHHDESRVEGVEIDAAPDPQPSSPGGAAR